jgi:hypothetical protein
MASTGQALTHAPQPVQRSTNSASVRAPGGRGKKVWSPRRNLARSGLNIAVGDPEEKLPEKIPQDGVKQKRRRLAGAGS